MPQLSGVFQSLNSSMNFQSLVLDTSVQLNRWVTPRLLNKYGVLCQFVGFNAEALKLFCVLAACVVNTLLSSLLSFVAGVARGTIC